MINKRFWGIIFLILKISIWASAFEEAYVEIKAKNLKDTFFMIYYDYDNDIPYIGVKAFKDFLEITTLNFDREKRTLRGKLSQDESEIMLTLPFSKEKLPGDDIYLPLENIAEIFRLKDYKWESDLLKIEVTPEYKLTYELLREAEQRIRKFENQKGEDEKYIDIYGDKKVFAPGILKLDYNNWNIGESSHNFKIEYGTQLFYGDLYIGQTLAPEITLDTITLEYRNFMNRRGTLLLGDSYLQMGEYYDIDRNIRGITYTKEDVVAYSRSNETIISGRVIGARLVELLQNNSLLDYERMNGGENYRFNVKNSSPFTKYSLKIYYEDGRIETKDVNVLSNGKLLPKGEDDYSFQIGESSRGKDIQQQYNYRYGVTENLSLGTAFIKGEGEDGPLQSIEGELIYRLPLNLLPTVLDLKVLNEKNDDRPSFISRIDQKIGDVGFYAEYENFGENLSKIQGYQKYYNLGVSKSFKSVNFNLGGDREIYGTQSIDNYYLNIGYTGFKDLSLYLYNEYENPKDFYKTYSFEARAVYSGIRFLNIIAETEHIFAESRDIDRTYLLKLNRKISRESSFRDLDLNGEIGHSKRDGFIFGISFTYYLDGDSMYIETPIDHRDGKTEIGLRAQKAFILESPLAKLNPKNVSDTWVEGIVFLDMNGDGLFNENEEPLSGIEVRVGTEVSSTDSEGRYLIGNLSGKSLQTVEIAGDSIDAMMKPKYEYRTIKPVSSTGTIVNMPISPVSIISGEIKVPDLSEKEFFKILSKVKIILKQNGEKIMETTPEFDGYYHLEDVLPGKYELEIEYRGDVPVDIPDSKFEIMISPGREGDYYENNDFILVSTRESEVENPSKN